MRPLNDFPPTRLAGLARLADFAPSAGRDYAARRNFDLGIGQHQYVSTLSPYLRHRVMTEDEVLAAVLARHSAKSAEKFVQEVFWRTYWKGWLEMRPGVWTAYQSALRQRLDEVSTQSGLRAGWEAACKGDTGIACFDAWAQELTLTGYLHNHARMWFASIWIFTLRLPWELGADFFLRHLLDGDPASNTLSWRWVAGRQTQGKTYLARATNIEKYTEGRFAPSASELAPEAPAPNAAPHPPRHSPPAQSDFDPSLPTVLILHDDDLSPSWLWRQGFAPIATATLSRPEDLSPLAPAPHVIAWKRAGVEDSCTRSKDQLGPVTHGLNDAEALEKWARDIGAQQIVTPYAPVGPNATVLNSIKGIPVIRPIRAHDLNAWPHATAGFFKFKEKIPSLLGDLRGLRAA
ncbi:FAD-binding domain-containing protein [Primorskyibacter sp. 2E233]|uniref:FAD-binding domain-containing protein n=1 Tax=Primorskyibacter sp. 2E233 TaxID=3413431 RepID=UPI003BF35BA2